MNEKNTSQLWYTAAKRVAAVSAAFALILSVLLVVNYIQTKRIDPLNSKALNQLMLELQKDQQNEALKEQIRALDLLARKAYFTNVWQVRTGGYLLFFFALISLISLKYMSSLQIRLPDLTSAPDAEKNWENRLLARKYILYTGLGLFAFAFTLSFLTGNDLSRGGFGIGEMAGKDTAFPGIEEIRQNWPNFRGPEGIGVAYSTSVPTQWNGVTGENILWKTEIPRPGFNSPVIWGKKIFLSGADRNTQAVYCIDADTGGILWQTELNDIPGTPDERPDNTEDTGYAAPTMATDGNRVFVLFGNGDTAGLDFEGNRIWAKKSWSPGKSLWPFFLIDNIP